MADLVKATIGIEFKGQAGINQAAEAIGKTEVALKKMVPESGEATQSLVNLSRVAQDAPYGFIGIANNINPLLESFQRLKASTGTTGGALKALVKELTGAGGIGLAVGVVSSLLVVFGDKLFGAGEKAKEAADEFKRVNDVLKEVSGSYQERSNVAAAGAADEIAKVNTLATVIQDQTKSYKERNNALNELKGINKNYFGDLTLETNSLATLTGKVTEYTNALIAAAIVKEFSSDIAKIAVEGAKASNKYAELSTEVERLNVELNKTQKYKSESISGGIGGGGSTLTETEQWKKLNKQYNEANNLLIKQGNIVSDLGSASVVAREGLSKAILESLKFKPLTNNIEIKPDKVTLAEPDKVTLAEPDKYVKLQNPIKLEVEPEINFKSLRFVMLGGDLMTMKEQVENNITKSIQKLVVKPEINLSPGVVTLDKLKKMQDGFKKLGESISGIVSPAINEMVNNLASGMNAFQAFGQAIVSVFKAVISKLIQTAILAAIISAISGGASNVAKGGLSFIQAFKGAFGGFRASGGPVGPGQSFIVGERGPELFTPGVSGNIVPNHRLGSVGSSFGGMQVSGVLVGRGNDLVAVINAAGRSNGRLV